MAHVSSQGHRVFRIGLFVGVLTNEVAWSLHQHFSVGIGLAEKLPLYLCDLSVFALIAGLATDRRFFAEWAFFSGAVGALLAVVFPASQKRAQSDRLRKLGVLSRA